MVFLFEVDISCMEEEDESCKIRFVLSNPRRGYKRNMYIPLLHIVEAMVRKPGLVVSVSIMNVDQLPNAFFCCEIASMYARFASSNLPISKLTQPMLCLILAIFN